MEFGNTRLVNFLSPFRGQFFNACCFKPDVCCLMLDHLPELSIKGGGLRLWRPLWMGLAGVQVSSSKQQASIMHQAARIKHRSAIIEKCVSRLWREMNTCCFARASIAHEKIFSRACPGGDGITTQLYSNHFNQYL